MAFYIITDDATPLYASHITRLHHRLTSSRQASMFSLSSWQVVFLLAPKLIHCQYQLQKDYFETGFYDNFDFFDGSDPTNGFVQYTGQNDNLISSSSTGAEMRVSTDQTTPNGRPSIRITSKDSYQNGLIVLDVGHMPGGICGTWPAFWTVGPNWPSGGEIGMHMFHKAKHPKLTMTVDIIEGVNDVQSNQMTLHTGSTCSISGTSMTGSISTDDCDVSNGDNSGCGITTTNDATYGSAFNANGGGTYATLITSTGVVVWFWPRGSEPGDVLSTQPNPSGWSTPLANFSGSCDFETSFTAQQIVFDTTFCGDWAGQVWSQGGCAAKAATCEDYVANNGADFSEAYWSINALKVYEAQSGSSTSAPSVVVSPSTPAPSAVVSPSTSAVVPPSASTSTGALSSTSSPPFSLTSTLSPVVAPAIPSSASVVANTTPLPSSPTSAPVPSLTTLITSVRSQSQRLQGPPQGKSGV